MPYALRSSISCGHANEAIPSLCLCPSDCPCQTGACRPPTAKAVPRMTKSEAQRILGTFPHCDDRVLHAPRTCRYCDEKPEWQALRVLYGINFTGESDPKKGACPAEQLRPAYQIHQWGGNRPTHAAVPTEARTRYERDSQGDLEEDELPETD